MAQDHGTCILSVELNACYLQLAYLVGSHRSSVTATLVSIVLAFDAGRVEAHRGKDHVPDRSHLALSTARGKTRGVKLRLRTREELLNRRSVVSPRQEVAADRGSTGLSQFGLSPHSKSMLQTRACRLQAFICRPGELGEITRTLLELDKRQDGEGLLHNDTSQLNLQHMPAC